MVLTSYSNSWWVPWFWRAPVVPIFSKWPLPLFFVVQKLFSSLLKTTTQNIDVHSVCSWERQAQCPLVLPSWTCPNSGYFGEVTNLRPHHRIALGIRIYIFHHAWTQGTHKATCRFTNIICIQGKKKRPLCAKREYLVSLTTYRRAYTSVRSINVQG